MFNYLEIHALLEENTNRGWDIKQAQIIAESNPSVDLHIDLQMGPIFIKIGYSMVD